MIITKLNGGLGNQMFEYACARNLQLKYGDELYLDVEGFRRSPRHYSLDKFVLSEDVKVLPIEQSRSLVLWQAISKMNRKAAFRLARPFGVYMWKTPTYKAIETGDTKKGKTYLYGYWQSERYFKENAAKIREELWVKSEYLPESLPYVERIKASESVCVHIRRGDYVQCGFLFCDEAYYLRGMDYIYERHPDAAYFIFTDDIPWVKENIHFRHPVVFVDMQDPDYEVLRLMYICKHFVMSNSSFSWWAQYLSDNPDKIVVAPSVWYPGGQGDNSMYLDSWTIL